jgi:hypothetical protein
MDKLKPKPYVQKNGYDYFLLKYTDRVVMYEQKVSDEVSRYEVFRYKIKDESIADGKVIPARFWYPPDEAFGYWAWTCMDYDGAMKRYEELEADESYSPYKRDKDDNQLKLKL